MNRAAKILLVDDQPEMALIVRLLARGQGHELTAHPDVRSTWEFLKSRAERLDLVLLQRTID